MLLEALQILLYGASFLCADAVDVEERHVETLRESQGLVSLSYDFVNDFLIVNFFLRHPCKEVYLVKDPRVGDSHLLKQHVSHWLFLMKHVDEQVVEIRALGFYMLLSLFYCFGAAFLTIFVLGMCQKVKHRAARAQIHIDSVANFLELDGSSFSVHN